MPRRAAVKATPTVDTKFRVGAAFTAAQHDTKKN